jgi:hypothetical protein
MARLGRSRFHPKTAHGRVTCRQQRLAALLAVDHLGP